MTTIYVVTDGNYSDYHIEGLYSTLEIAKEIHGEYCEVETWELDQYIEEHRQGLRRFRVMMMRDGTVHLVDNCWRDSCKAQDKFPQSYWFSLQREHKNIALFEVWARDEEHAIKIANERRVQWIANNQWVSELPTDFLAGSAGMIVIHKPERENK